MTWISTAGYPYVARSARDRLGRERVGGAAIRGVLFFAVLTSIGEQDVRAGANPERGGAQAPIHEDLSSLLDTIDDWVLVADLQGRVLYLNANAERQLGKLPGRARFDELWSTESRPGLELLLRAAREHTRLQLVTRCLPQRRIELRVNAGRHQGQPALIAVGREQLEQPAARGLADAALKFHALFDSSLFSMMITDGEGRFRDVNRGFELTSGFSASQVLGRTAVELGMIPPAVADEKRDTILTQPGGYLAVMDFKRRDGDLRQAVHCTTLVTIDGQPHGFTVSLDVTDYLRDQMQLRERVRVTRDRLQAMLQALPDLLFEFDEDGVVHDFFSSRRELLSQPPERFLGKHLPEITAPETAATVMRVIAEAIAKGISVGAQYQVPSPDGLRWFEMSAARCSELAAGGKTRVIAIARDITQRKLHEQELEIKNDELLRFTYTVSHDLKSPLVTIESFLGFLVDDLARADRERVEHDIQRIRSATGRMDSLLSDLLRLSRVGRKIHPSEHVALRQLWAEVCELTAGRQPASEAQLSGPDGDLQLWGDPPRLRELLQNLLDNALKFRRPGVAAAVRVAVEAGPDQSGWIVSVEDNGIGIDPRHQHKLFGLFEKLHPESEGSGIGLAIAKRIIDVHGGRIWIESQGEGHGTRVKFTLPGTKLEPGS